MSYVLKIWQQPADWPIPSDIYAIDELIRRVRTSVPGHAPLFVELAKRLTSRYPCICSEEAAAIPEEEWDTRWAWSDGPLNGITEDGVFNLGLNRNMLDEVRPFVIVEANAIGLNVMDDQAAEVHLANGTVISPHPEAQCLKGVAAYNRGDYKFAVEEFSRYASQGNPSAQYQLGLMYLDGHGTPKSKVIASALWTLAAMTNTDIKSAADWLAKQLTPEQVDAALLLTRAMRLAPDPLNAIAAHIRAREALYQKGREAMKNNDHTLVYDLIQPLADDGHPESQFMMGLLYGQGLGVTVNKSEAAKWYRNSADSGFSLAQYNLACMLADGDGVDQNEKEAAEWYRLAAMQGDKKALAGLENLAIRHRDWPAYFRDRMTIAERGDVAAQYEIGEMYIAGKGVELDEGVGLKWFRRAADGGYPDAQFALAHWSYTGEKLPKNIKEAVRWYRMASANGYPPAQHNLGVLYLRGEGVPKNRIVGLALLMHAKFCGHESGESIRLALGETEKVSSLVKKMKQPGQFLSAIDAYREDDRQSSDVAQMYYGEELRHLRVGGIAVSASMMMEIFMPTLESFLTPLALVGIFALMICTGAYGAWRIANGVGSSGLIKFFYAFMMALPFINLVAGAYLILQAYLGYRAVHRRTPATISIP